MLRGAQLEGLKELLSSIGGKEESDNSSKREQMKKFTSLALAVGLTSRQRELMLLLYAEGLNQKQAAIRLCMSQSAVSNMHRRAIERMKKLAMFML